MIARDVMSSPVLTVGPQIPVVEVAAFLSEQRIGGAPVVIGHEMVGIVTEKDLLHRQEIGTEYQSRAQAWWRRYVGPKTDAACYVRSHGRCVQHVMTRGVFAVGPDASLREITGIFERKGISRVPVLLDNRLVGIVAAADLVKALARGVPPTDRPGMGDQEMRDALLAELDSQEWWSADLARVEVTAGVVRFTGFYEDEVQREASHVAAENVAGLACVVDERRPVRETTAMI